LALEAGWIAMRYGIVFEQAPDGGVSAYLPDMPGVAVVAEDQTEALVMLDKAVTGTSRA
jgi:predicted RNase H-like HicB family nuclease